MGASAAGSKTGRLALNAAVRFVNPGLLLFKTVLLGSCFQFANGPMQKNTLPALPDQQRKVTTTRLKI